jgi:hypothetical protein
MRLYALTLESYRSIIKLDRALLDPTNLGQMRILD